MSGEAAAALVIAATRASGTIVRVDVAGFLAILGKTDAPLVVHTKALLATRQNRYLTSYKGLAFFTKSRDPLSLPVGTELIQAEKIWIP